MRRRRCHGAFVLPLAESAASLCQVMLQRSRKLSGSRATPLPGLCSRSCALLCRPPQQAGRSCCGATGCAAAVASRDPLCSLPMERCSKAPAGCCDARASGGSGRGQGGNCGTAPCCMSSSLGSTCV